MALFVCFAVKLRSVPLRCVRVKGGAGQGAWAGVTDWNKEEGR